MKPKEKARELVGKFTEDGLSNVSDSHELEKAKRYAMICADEILNENLVKHGAVYWYWNEVKSEIEKITK